MRILLELFSWPGGIVVGNLIASAMWAPLGIVHLDRLARRHHKQHMDQLGHCPGCDGNHERTAAR